MFNILIIELFANCKFMTINKRLLLPRSGAMNPYSAKEEPIKLLLDIQGKFDTQIFYKEKNIIYQLKGNKTVPCDIDKDSMIKGYQFGLELLKYYKNDFFIWFDQKPVQNMPVRFIPMPTFKLAKSLKDMCFVDGATLVYS